jgi:hypothetical protein
MKSFARKVIAAQTARPGGVAGVRPCDLLPMFDSRSPGLSGSLAGESFAAALESHPRYPKLRNGRHRALFELLDNIVANHIDRRLMLGLGFDEIGIVIYRAATLTAFRAARPSNRMRSAIDNN